MPAVTSLLIILAIWLLAFLARLASGKRSSGNERALRAQGAVEHGQRTTAAIILLHLAIYLGALVEALVRAPALGAPTLVGAALLVFAFLVLRQVQKDLGPLWTGKLLVAPVHPVARSWLFRTFRHPNYLLNVAPELVGIILVTQAWVTAALLVPYAACILLRIRQEEAAMASVPGWTR
jgi:isoprenylcysteine carboxyl methyltransferase (ICMT) family protein YpbQ